MEAHNHLWLQGILYPFLTFLSIRHPHDTLAKPSGRWNKSQLPFERTQSCSWSLAPLALPIFHFLPLCFLSLRSRLCCRCFSSDRSSTVSWLHSQLLSAFDQLRISGMVCFSSSSTAVKRHHVQGNLERKNLLGACLQFQRVSVHWPWWWGQGSRQAWCWSWRLYLWATTQGETGCRGLSKS